MPDEDLQVSGRVTVEDLARFQHAHSARTSGWIVVIFATVAIPVAVGVLLDGSSGSSDGTPGWAQVAKNATPWGLMMLLWIVLIFVRPRFIAKKQISQQAVLQQPVTFSFTDESFGQSGPINSWSAQWAVLKRVRETRSLFVLYHGANTGVVLPKRFFDTPGQIEQFRRIVLSNSPVKAFETGRWLDRWL